MLSYLTEDLYQHLFGIYQLLAPSQAKPGWKFPQPSGAPAGGSGPSDRAPIAEPSTCRRRTSVARTSGSSNGARWERCVWLKRKSLGDWQREVSGETEKFISKNYRALCLRDHFFGGFTWANFSKNIKVASNSRWLHLPPRFPERSMEVDDEGMLCTLESENLPIGSGDHWRF